jgi:hypothetical protein
MRPAKVQVGQVGPGRLDGGLVDPPQVVCGNGRPGAAGDAVAAPGSGQDQVLGLGAAGELAADGLADLVAQGTMRTLARLLGSALKPRPNRPAS